MRRVILTDVDETLLAFTPAFDAWMAKQGFKKREDTQDQYSLAVAYGLPERSMNAVFEAFFDTPQSGQLEPAAEAHEVVPRLYAAGYDFIAITASPQRKGVVYRRMKNIESALGIKLRGYHAAGLGQHKVKWLWQQPKGVWVEDHLQHAIAGSAAGHRTFLLDRPWNAARIKHQRVTRVMSWRCIERYLAETVSASTRSRTT